MEFIVLRILVVDDEVDLAEIIVSYFEREGYEVESAFDGPNAVEKAKSFSPDLIVLDVMLPGFDGVEVCRQVRLFSDAYILMLTARGEEIDKVVGFAVGADDYVVKPFSPRELVARAKAMLRRPRQLESVGDTTSSRELIKFGEITVNSSSRVVNVGEHVLDLTKTEFDILEILVESPKVVFSRKKLLDELWGGDWHGELQVIDVHVAHLRKKLIDAGVSADPIRTIRGVGYGMVL
jgi:DNA-binding response OmpR family regulator